MPLQDLGDIVERYLAISRPQQEPSPMDLRALWNTLLGGPGEPSAANRREDQALEGLLAFIAAAHALDGASGEQLDLRAGGWTVDATGGLVRTALSAALLTGVLALAGVTALSPVVLPAVLPLLFDVRRARVSATGTELLAELAAAPGVVGQVLSAQELYERLPPATKDEVSHLELGAFLAELQEAGLADKKGEGYVLRPPDKARFRVTWR